MDKTIERARTFPPLPEIDDLTRREFLVGTGSLLILGAAGCGGGENEEVSSSETRTVRHALGETEVPSQPGRVVVLIGDAGVDAMLTLGVVPVGAAISTESGLPVWFERAEFPVEVEPGEIESLGEANEPNLESIAAIEPDVIVGWDYQVEETYDQLSGIAPTVGISPSNGPEWKEAFRGVADAVNRGAEYEEYLRSYDEKLEELRSGLEGDPADYTASVLWNFDDSAIYLYGEPSQPGSIVLDAGFPEIIRAEAMAENAASRRVMEKLGMAYEKTVCHEAGDQVFYTITQEEFSKKTLGTSTERERKR